MKEQLAANFAKLLEHIAPITAQIEENVSTAIQPLAPYIAIAQEKSDLVKEFANKTLPTFEGVNPIYVGLFVIAGHVLLYNLIAKLEYKTKIFTMVIGGFLIRFRFTCFY